MHDGQNATRMVSSSRYLSIANLKCRLDLQRSKHAISHVLITYKLSDSSSRSLSLWSFQFDLELTNKRVQRCSFLLKAKRGENKRGPCTEMFSPMADLTSATQFSHHTPDLLSWHAVGRRHLVSICACDSLIKVDQGTDTRGRAA